MFIYDNILLIIICICLVFTRSIIVITVVALILARFVYSPDIHFSENETFFYSPCDGYVKQIVKQDDMYRITVFLTLFNNHTQYIPRKCIIKDVIHKPGGYANAYAEHSINNEKVIIKCKDDKFDYEIHQVTGLLTRRILTYVSKEQTKNAGDKLGFIILGSRVDIILPINVVDTIIINVGDRIYPSQEIVKLN